MTAARDWEARALWLFYEDGPNLPMNHPESHDTISSVSYFTDKPSEQPVFATAIPSGNRAHTGTTSLASGRYAGQTSPPPIPKCEPMLT